jgi:threonine dehydratase
VASSTDLSPARIEAAQERVDPVFLNTPQFVDERLSTALDREVLIKNETVTPIGSFKGRGTWLLSEQLDASKTWVCSTAGNFGQGVAYAGRARGAQVDVFVAPEASAAKVASIRDLGAAVHESDEPERSAREFAAASDNRHLIVDGREPAIAEGAGTIGAELDAGGPIDLAVIQIGDGALIAGVACWLKHSRPDARVIGVCAAGAPAMAQSFAARRVITTAETNTIATTLAISEPIPESLARLIALVDEIVLVSDDDLRGAQRLISDTTGISVEPAGAAGVAALQRHGESLGSGRAAVVLTGVDG